MWADVSTPWTFRVGMMLGETKDGNRRRNFCIKQYCLMDSAVVLLFLVQLNSFHGQRNSFDYTVLSKPFAAN